LHRVASLCNVGIHPKRRPTVVYKRRVWKKNRKPERENRRSRDQRFGSRLIQQISAVVIIISVSGTPGNIGSHVRHRFKLRLALQGISRLVRNVQERLRQPL
jgi:hypothetical protein